MSNNFGDDLEQRLEERQNTFGAIAALNAANQRQNQLRAMQGVREEQAKIARTEEQRLKIEQQRFELESARVATQKAEAEAVKVLRRLMAGVGAELDAIEQG